MKFYRNMIGAVSAVYIIVHLAVGNVFSLTNIVSIILLLTVNDLMK